MHAPGFRFTWFPRLLLLELFASVRFRLWLLPLPLLFFSSCACLVSSETATSRMLTVALAPDTERTFAFGRSFCSVSGSAPSSLVASWCGSLGACLPFVPCLFLWSRCHFRVMDGELERFFPSGCFLFQLLGLPCFRSGGGRHERQSLAGPSVLRDDCLVPVQVSPLPLLRYPVCLSRAPAFRQVRVAMLAEGSLESPSVLVLAFHSSLFLVEGSSDGSAPGDRFLSPGWLCSFTPFRLRSVASALSLLGSGLFFLL